MAIKPQLRALAVIAAAGLALTACGSSTSSTATGGTSGGSAPCGNYKIAFLGATTGPYGALGQNMVGGIKLALDDYNKANADCKVGFEGVRLAGRPDQGHAAGDTIVQDSTIIGAGRTGLLR